VDERDLSPLLPLESPHHGFRGDGGAPPPRDPVPAGLTIAISREAGARGGTIGRRVGRLLSWQVYDQELLEYVIQDSNVQQGLRDSLPEPALRWVDARLDALSSREGGSLPPAMANLARLSLTLGAQGHVVLIGRGAGYLLPRASTLHARLVAPMEDRVAYMAQWLRLTVEEAQQRVRVRDQRRAEFLTHFLHRQAGEVYGYDLVLNTSSLGEELCAELIVRSACSKERQFLGRSEGDSEFPIG
jgi:hypothetical protein